LLLAIDGAIAAFDHFESVDFDPARESQAAVQNHNQITALYLLDMMSAALRWIESKDGHSSTRRPAVVCLVEECCRVLGGRPFTDYGIVIPPNHQRTSARIKAVAASLRWTRMKSAIHDLQLNSPGKALDEHYWLEANIGGSNPEHGQGGASRDGFLAGQHKHFLAHRASGGAMGQSVYQLDARSRPHFQVHFQQGRPYRRAANGTLTLVEQVAGHMFVADLSGHFYCTFGDPSPQGTVWHHSSFMSGQPVGFAGGVVIADGFITEIDTISGHYKPKSKQLLWALQTLKQRYQLELAEIQVTSMYPEDRDGETWIRTMVFESAQKYLSMKSFLRPTHDLSMPPPPM